MLQFSTSRIGSSQGCYIHIPFCERKCAYCDFNSHSGHSAQMFERYARDLIAEIESANASAPPVDSIFIGGGTPTAIPAELTAKIIDAVRAKFEISNRSGIEITVEANPGSSDAAKFERLRAAGANRVSIGVQSFDDHLLLALGRIHTSSEALSAIRAAKEAGFENISIDLMFSLPDQTIDLWRKTLDIALSLDISHISMYSLIVEDGTPFGTRHKKGELILPSDDEAADMFELARSEAQKAGMLHYEISNYARPGAQCAHNLHYWRNENYYGFGAGAVSYQGGARETRIYSPKRYCENIEQNENLITASESPSLPEQMGETMMLGLRLVREGVDCGRFRERFGISPQEKWPKQIERFVRAGFLEANSGRIRLTERALFLASEVMAEFL